MTNLPEETKTLIKDLVYHEKAISRLLEMHLCHSDINDKRNYSPEQAKIIAKRIDEHREKANKIKEILGL